VITSISKKTGPEVDFLSTSQLLQMAGRAGRRGLDEEGTVVIACKQRDTLDDAHRILVSPIEPIVSQMKSSYGFVVRLLSTRTLKECYALIERGFGAFVYHKKLLQKS
jgi:superfamily II RNA helicase